MTDTQMYLFMRDFFERYYQKLEREGDGIALLRPLEGSDRAMWREDADPDEVAELVRPAGFPKQKGKAIVDCCRMLRDEYGGEVPRDTEELLKLPMVGRKTAACVRSYAMDIPSVCVDTHVHRISNLMGLVDTKTPEETEFALMDITPRERWSDINRYFRLKPDRGFPSDA